MCFYNDDYDWTVGIQEETTAIAEKEIKCNECYRLIKVGETVHHIYQQEHEEEQECEWCEEGKVDGEKCIDCVGTGFSGPGETFDYDRCEECDKFLKAVEAAEIEAGCDQNEARPNLGTMFDDIRDNTAHGDIEGVRRYFRKAITMFPELKASGYLTMAGKRLCG